MSIVSRQIDFEFEGERYPVALTVNSLCGLEEMFGGRSISVVGEEIASGRAGARGVRALFRAAVIAKHPEVTERDAGRMVDHLGSEEAGSIIMGAFESLQRGLEAEPPEMPKADQRGRLAFEVGGERIVLVFGMNAQAELEDYFDGLQPEEIARKIATKEISLRDLRAMFRAALIDDRDVSLEGAGDVIDRVGLRVAGSAVAQAFVGAFPQAAAEMKGGDDDSGNRQQRRAAASGRAHPTKRKR